MTETTDELVADYRQRLHAAAADLPPEVRDDLLDDVEAHLAEVREASTSPQEARTALQRLGSPEELAAAARAEAGLPSGAPPPVWAQARRTSARRFLDVLAVLLVLLGAVLGGLVLAIPGALLGWATGIVLLWSSPSWTTGQKTLGTTVFPGGLALPLLLPLVGTQTCSQSSMTDEQGITTFGPEVCEGFAFPIWLGIPLLIVTLLTPVLVSIHLLRRADRQAS